MDVRFREVALLLALTVAAVLGSARAHSADRGGRMAQPAAQQAAHP